ncbi:hypothetical protein [Paenibacillus monticola]|uniref:ATP-grasp domain-containing protein n=1 Tax=Paenibacillus monticola TaxID=2666075 RepID=A0A7X2L4Q0_9BACL|nr:hypothetical protein [Paenibacillus monticola]MRN57277.1 hypothetical protein [Paenibacillus monticola]
MEDDNRRVYCATFDAEQYWRDPMLAKLPFIPDRNAQRIVSVMDELMFLFCQPGDAILTRKPFNPVQKQYLQSIGFDFESNVFDLDPRSELDKCIFQLLCESDNKLQVSPFLEGQSILAPFAVLPYAAQVCESYNLQCFSPGNEIVQNVNSKLYSHQMKDRLDIRNVGVIVHSSEELHSEGQKLLSAGDFLIKDLFGVSGKGNLLVQSSQTLDRMVSYITSQEQKGKYTQFVLEPLLHKKDDFSCQFYISAQGETTFIAVSKLLNDGFAYTESSTPDESFMQFLEAGNYFILMERLAKELFKDGYYGHVCVDSMILEDGEMVPLIEINARKSMSLIKHQVDQYLQQYELRGNLSFLSVSSERPDFSYEQLLNTLHDEGLLYSPANRKGVLPLSASTLEINKSTMKAAKGRLYYSIVSPEAEEKKRLNEQLRSCFSMHSYRIYN